YRGGFMVIARYNVDGTLDASYTDGSGPDDGIVISTVGFGGEQWDDSAALAVAIADDGKILVGGRNAPWADYLVERRLPNGQPDPDFGGNGIVAVDWGGSSDSVTKLIPQPDGGVGLYGVT